jgi:spore germination protein YaaH
MNLPADSILLTDGIRLPGPNTPFTYLRDNIKAFVGPPGSQDPFMDRSGQSFGFVGFDDFGDAVYNDSDRVSGRKLMMGVAMYGYTYPLAHVLASGNTQAVSPPTSPTSAKDNSTEEQAKYRLRADQREAASSTDAARILAAKGDPVTIREIRDVFTAGKALVRKDASSGEAYFDYLKLKEDGSIHTREDGSKAPVAWYRRAYWPTPATIKERIEVVEENGVKSIALWDIGQGGAWLLHSL